MSIELLNIDCMEYMRGLPDKAFDLAIVDPPYGMDTPMDGTRHGGRVMRKWKREPGTTWDIAPDAAYFTELRRVSAHQIIWGANNFIAHLSRTTNYIFWFKHQPAPNFADGELAWTSFSGPARCLDLPCFGAHGIDVGGKVHPTQKPVALYRWLLQNYAKPGQRILDTHGGSMSIAIACDIEGYDLTLCEIDKDYFEAGRRRLEQHRAQPRLFKGQEHSVGRQLQIE